MFIPARVQFTNKVAEQACVDYPLWSDLCANEIEQRIVRAYVQLVFQAVDAANPQTVVVMRLGSLEVRLAKLDPEEINRGLPSFWVEIFDWPHQASIDSIGFYEFEEDELAAAVEMIIGAAHDADTRNRSPQH
jgi:hypothetical protein